MHQDAGEADQSQDGVEAERLLEEEKHGNGADEAERRRQNHHAGGREGADLERRVRAARALP